MKHCPDCQVEIKGWELFCPRCSKALRLRKPRKIKSESGDYSNNLHFLRLSVQRFDRF